MSEDVREVQPTPSDAASLPVSDLSELLRLLAFTRQQAETANHGLAEARDRADREAAIAAGLRGEIAGMTAAVTDLEDRIVVAEESRRHAEARTNELEVQLAAALEGARLAQRETLDTRAERDALRAELHDVLRSTSWRLTAPVRSVSGRLSREQTPDSQNGG